MDPHAIREFGREWRRPPRPRGRQPAAHASIAPPPAPAASAAIQMEARRQAKRQRPDDDGQQPEGEQQLQQQQPHVHSTGAAIQIDYYIHHSVLAQVLAYDSLALPFIFWNQLTATGRAVAALQMTGAPRRAGGGHATCVSGVAVGKPSRPARVHAQHEVATLCAAES